MKNAVAFYRAAYEGKPPDAWEKYVGAEYMITFSDINLGEATLASNDCWLS